MRGSIDFSVELSPRDPAWDEASALLQAGFHVETETGVSARDFMRAALRFPDEYIERSVSTVFLDSSPVDDIDAAIVRGGSTMALSAAMPGLVGAMMRRGSFYASCRASISYAARAGEAAASGAGRAGLVRVKLFNSIMRDRGRDILARGIFVGANAARGILVGRAPAPAGRVPGADDLVFLRVAERREST